ncbi:alpha/beta-hydrolase [Hyaloraphidium curvatum]|nr:alpha/beta-hydrolase [Hyaloraphidium curvatum]
MTESSNSSNGTDVNGTLAAVEAAAAGGSTFLAWSFSILRAGLVVVGATVIAGCTLLYIYQNEIIYPSAFPPGSRQVVFKPPEFGMPDYEDLTLETSDGFSIRVYVIRGKARGKSGDAKEGGSDGPADAAADDGLRQRKRADSKGSDDERAAAEGSAAPGSLGTDPDKWSEYTLVFFHANAGNMGHRLPIARWFHARFGCNIVMLDYRGYGFSTGKPNEAGIRTDVKTTMDYIYNHPVLGNTKLVLYGQSIGGAVTIDTAARPENQGKIHGIIVENTFLSLAKLVPEVMPIIGKLRLTWMVKDKWNSEESIARISSDVPMCFLSGARDELIREHNMHALYHAAKRRTPTPPPEHGWWFSFPNGTHNDTVVMPGYMDRIAEFWFAMVSRTRPPPPRSLASSPTDVAEEATE